MRKAFASLILISFATAILAQQQTVVVVAPPPPPPSDGLTAPDPYGACLPNLTGAGCKPNPYYKPDYTVGVINPTAIYQQNQAATENASIGAALRSLETELALLQAARAAEDGRLLFQDAQQSRARSALAGVIKAQQELERTYRTAWPAWSAHWSRVSPSILTEVEALQKSTAGSTERGCSRFMAFTESLKVAIPPAPGQNLEALHGAVYNLRLLCSEPSKSAPAVSEAAAAALAAVEQTDEWAEGRSNYYTSAAP